MKLELAVAISVAEYNEAVDNYPKFNSPHEGFAILKEEIDELWQEVKTNGSFNNHVRMTEEAKQVAAMALRFMTDCC